MFICVHLWLNLRIGSSEFWFLDSGLWTLNSELSAPPLTPLSPGILDPLTCHWNLVTRYQGAMLLIQCRRFTLPLA